MEDKRRSELEEEMSRFEQEIAGQLPPPPKIPSLPFFKPPSSSSNVSAPPPLGESIDSKIASSQASKTTDSIGLPSHGHRMQGHFQALPPQNILPPGLPMHPLPPPGMPPRPQLPMPPVPNLATPPIGLPRGNAAPLVPPPMGPATLIPPPIPPMIPIIAPAPVQNVAPTTSSAPVIKPPTVPLDNYEPLSSTGDWDDGGEGGSGDRTDDSKKKDKKKKYVRVGGGTVWEDDSLSEWDPNDFRIFVGDLGNEVTDEHLYRAFSKYASVLKARVIRDRKTKKTKGFGFVSFKDPQDYLKAMREMNGKYVGNRPIKLRKSTWKDRNIEVSKKKEKEKKKLGLR